VTTRVLPPRLVAEHISKSFPGVRALDDVSLEIRAGEIHALLGENGAGKSTLVKIIYGVQRPDTGTMRMAGEPFAPARPAAARAAGVGMVFQHFSLFEALSVGENVAVGLDGRTADAALAADIVRISSTYGLDLDPVRIVGTLSVGERQRVEIVRCLLQNPRLIIMDEPTSVLTPQEAVRLFATLRQLAAEGRSILYISHKLEEIRSLCETATILRGGRKVATCDPRIESVRSLAARMIGATVTPPTRADREPGPARLQVSGLSLAADHTFGTALHEVTFEVRGGEILGIAGVAGNGQIELLEALIGERAVTPGAIRVDGVAVGGEAPPARRARGMAFVPEQRLGHGAVPSASLAENMLLADTRGGLVDWPAQTRRAARVVETFAVKTTGVERPARGLSGGNLQKFIIGRELAGAPGVLVIGQPTWGVDAGAAAMIHQALLERAAAGAAIVVVSQDLDELFTLADRIAVMAGGRLSAPMPIAAATPENIGRLMGGV
jgi:simple sugar transport system ATP-binding protein